MGNFFEDTFNAVKKNAKYIDPLGHSFISSTQSGGKGGAGGGGGNTAAKALAFMDRGEAKGEELAGGTAAEMGQGRADIRDRLQEILSGNSAGAASLRQSQQQQQKSLKSSQALAGGGQMNAGQQMALKRQSDIDVAKFTSNEKRRALSDLSKEYRGGAGDVTRMSGQYGAVLVGSQKPAQPKEKKGGMFSFIGDLF